MKIIREISDATLGIGLDVCLGEKYELRKTARAVLVNETGEIATVFLARDNFHKLPGGGLEIGESILSALKREVLEEIGCQCEVTEPIGVVLEYRAKYHLLQISYAFGARVVGDIGIPQLEDKEIEEGLRVEWLNPREALARMKTEQSDRYESQFILAREVAILEAYLVAAK